jgi:putative ABC transport system substrate-binding protein
MFDPPPASPPWRAGNHTQKRLNRKTVSWETSPVDVETTRWIRDVISRRALLAGTICALARPGSAAAQRPGRVSRVGVLANGAAASSSPLDEFRRGLRDLGHIEGQNVVVEIRWAEGRFERMPEFAANLVRWTPDVLVTAGPYGLAAARHATSTIPIVMIACDPADTMVERIARPSGHITGVTCMSSDLTPKRLQLLKETLPAIQRVAVLYNPFDPNKADEVRQMQAAAGALGVRLQPVEMPDATTLEEAVAEARRGRADALFVLPDPVTLQERRRIAELAAKHRLPSMYGFREFVAAGGLISYGTMQADLYRRAAAHVDRILRGAAPAQVPVEQATRFELVVNLRTAKALGLTIPPSVLLRADHVIE